MESQQKLIPGTEQYNPDYEPPKESQLVKLLVGFTKWLGRESLVTPHCFGGSNLAKVEYEYDSAHLFLEKINFFCLTPAIFDNKDVLDVGCGWGGKMIFYAENTNLKSISGFDLPGICVPEVSAEFAKSKNINNCFFSAGYAENMPYESEKFDLIIMEDVLEHVNDPEKVMRECHRVLKQNGSIVVVFPSFKSIFAHHLDRAIALPAAHYLLPMKVWASGLNYLLLNRESDLHYEPFKKIVQTKYCESITKDLNGLDLANFKIIVAETNFKSHTLKLVPARRSMGRSRYIKPFYDLAFNLGIFREPLSMFIFFYGQK